MRVDANQAKKRYPEVYCLRIQCLRFGPRLAINADELDMPTHATQTSQAHPPERVEYCGNADSWYIQPHTTLCTMDLCVVAVLHAQMIFHTISFCSHHFFS